MKKSKLYLLLLIGLTIGAGSLLWQSLQRNDFLIFPISYNERMVPTIDIKIEDTTYPVELRVGWDRPLMLKKEILDTLTKTPLGMTKRYPLTKDSYLSPTYLIPKISIGDLTLTNIIVIQAQEYEFNSLGKYLGREMNLLLDFPNSCIIACNSFSKLKQERLTNQISRIYIKHHTN